MSLSVQVEAPADSEQRGRDLIDHFISAPANSDIEVAVGIANGHPGILVTIDKRNHVLFAPEAKALALGLECAMNKYPNSAEAKAVPDLIMGLRAAADLAEEMAKESAQ